MHAVPRRTLLAVLILAASLAGTFLLPARSEADPPCPYTSIRQTSTQDGYGFTCTAATDDLMSNVLAEAEADCLFGSVILAQLTITDECHAFSPELVEVSGYLRYRCMYCM